MTRKGQTVDLKERLYRHFMPIPFCGCWLWTSKLDKDGYGSMKRSDSTDYKAHRVSYEVHVGSIPEGHEIRHSCDVRSCINPAHLSTGTHKQNIDDRTARRPKLQPAQCSFAKVTAEQIQEIRASTESPRRYYQKYGISLAQAYRIKNGECWPNA